MTKPGKVIGFKVESSKPEDSAENVAIELAASLQLEMNARADAAEFKEQAQRERKKALDFSGVMIMLNEYQRKKEKTLKAGEEWNPSRMEPMESYDMDMIKEERLMLIGRAKELDELATDAIDIANGAQKKSLALQKKLINVSKG